MNTLKDNGSKEKESQLRNRYTTAEQRSTVPSRPSQIPAYAKETLLHALEEISILTWPFFGVTNAWVVNSSNVACTIMTYLTAPEYRTIGPGENVRFQIAGE